MHNILRMGYGIIFPHNKPMFFNFNGCGTLIESQESEKWVRTYRKGALF